MVKRLAALILMIMIATTFGAAQATELVPYDGPEWTFEVSLGELDESLLTLASPLSPITAEDDPKELVFVKSRKSGEEGENLNGGVRKATNTKMELRREAYNALMMLFTAAEDQGIELYLRQGFRSYEELADRYGKAADRKAADGVPQAGQTDYQTGLAVMVVGKAWRAKSLTAEFAQSAEYRWLTSNCARFGFVVRYPEFKEELTGCGFEPWHLRYVGAEVAEYMVNKGLCLEEFHRELDAARAEFVGRGGDVKAALAAEVLPEGPVILDDMGPDGDHEITIFHD